MRQNQSKPTTLSLLPKINKNNKTEQLRLSNQTLSNEEELIITKCLSAWYNISKEEMINSLVEIIKENPNTHLIKRIITDLVNKLSDDPREQRLQKMGHYRDMLFSDYIKEWLKSIENQVAKSTYKGYYDHANGRMIPYFENEELLLKDVTLADIYNYIEYLFSEGLKPNTVKHHRSILSCIFTRAVEQELFEYNFINNLKPIKADHYIGNFYKHEELLHLFEVVKNTTIRLEVIIAAVYGLRREEVLGLKWDCIDFNRKTITIKHTVQRFKINGKTQFVFKNKTKSQSSYRTLPLFDFIEVLLNEYKEMYAEYKKIFGNTYCSKYKARRTYHYTKKAGAPITRPPVNRIGRPIPLQEAHPKTGLSWHSHTAIIKTLFKISRPNFTGCINLVIKLFADGIFFDIIVMFKIFDVYGAVAKW